MSQARDRLCQSLSKSTFDAVLHREAEPYSQLPFLLNYLGTMYQNYWQSLLQVGGHRYRTLFPNYSKIIPTLTIQNDQRWERFEGTNRVVLKFCTSSPVNSLPVYGTILRAIFSTRKNRLLICFKIYLLSKLVFKYDKLNNYAKKNRFKGTLSIHAVWDKSPLIIFSRTTNCTRPTGLCNLVTLFKNLLFLIYTKLRSKSCGELHQGDFPSKRSCTRSEIW